MPCCGSETVIAKIKTKIQSLNMPCCRYQNKVCFYQSKESIFSIFVWLCVKIKAVFAKLISKVIKNE